MGIVWNFALDSKDNRDYTIGEILWSTTEIPPYKLIWDIEIQDQKKDWWTYWCVFYSSSSISNTMNYITWSNVKISWSKLCEIAVKEWLLDKNSGAYIVSWPKLLLKLWYIEWYWLNETIYDIKKSICNNMPVLTWSKSISWNETIKNDNIAVKWNSYGHAFFICGYDDNKWYFICENSYWENKYEKWYFYLKYTDFNLLFNSKYSMIDKKDLITDYQQKILDWISLEWAKRMFLEKKWNWKDPKKPMSREEVMEVLSRM